MFLDHFKHTGEVQRAVAMTLLFHFVSSTKKRRGETKIRLSTGIISDIGYAGNISTGALWIKATFVLPSSVQRIRHSYRNTCIGQVSQQAS